MSNMDERTIIKIFYRFLKEEGIFSLYFKNLYRQRGCSLNEKVCYIVRECPEGLINYAFNWSTTPQGHEFWETIHSQWVYIYSRAASYAHIYDRIVLV